MKHYFKKANTGVTKVSFIKNDIHLESDNALQMVKQEFDCIVCLNVTKWIHLNHGDNGLRRFFKRCFLSLHKGGVLVLEPQPLSSYDRRKRLSVTTNENFQKMELKPDQFPDFLVSLGFSEKHIFANEEDCSFSKFSRPIYIFFKK